MTRETIDFGIDLGTTNSAVARMDATGAVVVRNNDRREFTPSAVYVNPAGSVYVGDRARSRVGRDAENVCTEFKLQMGVTGPHKTFPAAGTSMTPEELSAEVLKSLRADVQRETGEAITSAVITVPAAFELDQCDATVRAAKLAGLQNATLIQEPTAAAWAYGAESRDERAFWLVYDFGGGTFDAAVISVADGEFTVVNHAGDNYLGGKVIDWALVENVLVPALERHDPAFVGVSRADPRWSGTMAKLKMAAEKAKIDLSAADPVEVEVDLEVDGRRTEFVHELRRSDVEAAASAPFSRSVNLCRQALAEQGLSPNDLSRVIMVGGTTLIPMVRDRLADPTTGLGVVLEYGIDPVTVVARGAAIFASSLQTPREVSAPTTADRVTLDLGYPAVGQDVDPLVVGRAIASTARDWSGWTVEFVNTAARPQWSSGRLGLGVDGTFSIRLRAEEDTVNVYAVTLCDPHGGAVPTDRDHVTYRHTRGAVGGDTTTTFSLGVALSDNTVAPLIPKGAELPTRSRRVVLYTTVAVQRASASGLIRVPIVQGERTRADRNTTVGTLELSPTDVRHDVRANSEVEILLSMDASQKVQATAFVPVLDEEFPIDVDLGRAPSSGGGGLAREAADLAERVAELRERSRRVVAPDAERLLARMDGEQTAEAIETLVAAARNDPDAEQPARARIRETHALLDDVEEALTLPALVAEVQQMRNSVRRLAEELGDADDRRDLTRIEIVVQEALDTADRTVLARQVEVLNDLAVRILRRSGRLDSVQFGNLERALGDDPDPGVQNLIRRGRDAADRGDTEELRLVVVQLRQRLPQDDPGATAVEGSTVSLRRR